MYFSTNPSTIHKTTTDLNNDDKHTTKDKNSINKDAFRETPIPKYETLSQLVKRIESRLVHIVVSPADTDKLLRDLDVIHNKDKKMNAAMAVPVRVYEQLISILVKRKDKEKVDELVNKIKFNYFYLL